MTRDEVIERLSEKFGPHQAAVSREPDEDHRRKWWELVPDGKNAEASAMLIFQDTDGHNSMRALTYGEIADALCSQDEEKSEA